MGPKQDLEEWVASSVAAQGCVLQPMGSYVSIIRSVYIDFGARWDGGYDEKRAGWGMVVSESGGSAMVVR